MSEPESFESDIAIIGMSGRFPGAPSTAELWTNLLDGRESISFFTEEELRSSGVDPALSSQSEYVRARGALDQIDLFDAGFFGCNAREAAILDPQHRIFLECAVEALEDAAHFTANGRERIGVFAGASLSTYLLNNLLGRRDVTGLESWIACDKDHLATSVAYRLDLRGPAISVQTACSTSLVAVHMACQSLLAGETDLALAGGVSITVPHRTGYLYQRGGVFSPDGHCRAFDAGAQGTVSGNGAGVVVLRRLTDALDQRDPIYAVIRGSAINNDGASKVGYTAPSIDGQSAVIAEAIALARVPAESISFIEAHGTGTELGDPVEVRALTQAFRRSTAATRFCAIGSIKTNIGHLDAAAGVAGLIKTVLALQHRTLPASLHFRDPHPMIDFAASPFYVNAETRRRPANGRPLRAGVSSFGMGGTNAHVVLEEAPAPQQSGPGRTAQLLLLSAKGSSALEAATANLSTWLQDNPDSNLADVAFTLAVGRRSYNHKRIAVCAPGSDPATILATSSAPSVLTAARDAGHRSIAFLFPGQGAQYVNMGRELYREEPVFRREVDRCCETLKPNLGWDLRDVLYPTPENEAAASEQIRNTHAAQPALFVIEYSLARLWISWGIVPETMLGHSVGEYVAAALAGVFSVDDALRVVAARGRLMQSLPGGSMMAVPMSESELSRIIAPDISIAAINTPELCVVAGPQTAIDGLESQLTARGLHTRRLHTSHAFHSAMVDPILEPYSTLMAAIPRHAPAMSYISNVTGTWITPAQVTSPEYWARHLRGAVRFSDGLTEILKHKDRLLLEVGPGQALTSLAIQHKHPSHSCISSLPPAQSPQSDLPCLLGAVGRLWLAGSTVDWTAFYSDQDRRRLSLPAYPFQRRRYWMEPSPTRPAEAPPTAGKESDPDRWLWAPSWKQALALSLPSFEPNAEWLIFAHKTRFDDDVIARLRSAGQSITVVHEGAHFAAKANRTCAVNPEELADYESLFRHLQRDNQLPTRVLHLWTLKTSRFEQAQYRGLYSLIFISRAIAALGISSPIEVNFISSRLHDVTGDLPISPDSAVALGACRVIPQELSNLHYRNIDIGTAPSAAQVINECAASPDIQTVALRGGRRWIQVFDRVPPRSETAQPLRTRGVYLITGGLGKIGMALATHLAANYKAKLVLTGRSPSSPLAAAQIRSMESHGAQVLTVQADASDKDAMKRAFELAEDKFGTIHGVIHAAGFTGEEALLPVTETGPGHCRLHFSPKVAGVQILDSLIQTRPLDFCLLMSSLSTVLGGVGMCAYSAANHYLDALAHSRSRNPGTRWISVNWDGWSFDTTANPAITPAGGIAAFSRALTLGNTPQLIVSTTDLESRISQWIDRQSTDPTAESLHDRPELGTVYEAPRNDTERTLAAIWQELLAIERAGIKDNFFELGGNSLLALTLFSRIEKRLHRSLPISTLFDAPTIEQLAALLSGTTPIERTLPQTIVPIQAKGERTPLFCVHAVGGNVLNYRPLARRLGQDQPVYGIQAMGLAQDEKQLQSIEEMAKRYAADILAFQPSGPYHLAGVSFGGLLAYEIASQIEQSGHTLGVLALFDSAPGGAATTNERPMLGARAAILRQRAAAQVRELIHLDTHALLGHLLRKSRTLKRRIKSRAWQIFYRWYAGIGQPLPDSLRDLTETNYLAAKEYTPKPSRLRVTLFRATRRSIESELAADMGWGRLAAGGVEVHDMPGDHLSMLSEPNVRTVASTLRACLDRASAPAHEPAPQYATLAAAAGSKSTTRQFYNRINAEIDMTSFADASLFLNFGYASDETTPHNGRPRQNRLNGNSIELVLRLVDGCDRIAGDVLDVGCGRGGTVMTLHQHQSPRRTVAIDLSSSAIRFCRRVHRYPATHFLEGDAEHLPFQRESFDVVTSVESSHSYPNLRDFYAEVFRVLRPGGWFLYTDALPSSEMDRVRSLWTEIGLQPLADTDITTNVLRSCDQMAEAHSSSFQQRNEVMDDFLAVPGSRVYCGMQNGDLTYRIMRLRKP